MKTILFGAGRYSDKVIGLAKTNNTVIDYIVDNDSALFGEGVKSGISIKSPDILRDEIKGNCRVLIAVGKPLRKAIKEQLNGYGLREDIDYFENLAPFGLSPEIAKFLQEAKMYKKNGNIPAYEHALEYIKMLEANPDLCIPQGVELCNICNKQCPNCPAPTTKYQRGFASEETVKLAMKYTPPHGDFSLHGNGEPFLHKDFIKYLKMAAELEFTVTVSTNGILLDDALTNAIIEAKPRFMISLHSTESVDAFVNFNKVYYERGCTFYFKGQVLSHNEADILPYLSQFKDCDITDHIRYVQSHSWAGNVAERRVEYSNDVVKKRVENCIWIQGNRASVRWDGLVMACCLDTENETYLGTIYEFEKIKHLPQGYPMCVRCDSCYINNYQ